MMKIITSIVFFVSFIGFSQPGGGGGLSINNLYDDNLEPINLRDPSEIHLRTFFSGSHFIETFAYETELKNHADHEHDFATPWSSFSINLSSQNNQSRYSKNNHRVLIVYMGDTMIIDVLNIMAGNGAGDIDHMDSIVFSKGHYTYNRQPENFWIDHRDKLEYLTHGLTPATFNKLNSLDVITKSDRIDSQFLADLEVAPSHHLNKAAWAMSMGEAKVSHSSLNRAIEIGITNQQSLQEYYLLRAKYYDNTNVIDSSIHYISKRIEISRSEENYSLRVQYYTKATLYNKAIKDLDTIVMISQDKIGALKRRAMFFYTFLDKKSSAIQDLNEAINIAENTLVNQNNGYFFKYAYLYIKRGQILYSKGNRNAAYRDWIRAIHNWRTYPGKHFFDSIIDARKRDPEPYFCRAMANLTKASSIYSSELNNFMKQVIEDLEMCIELKYDNHLIYYYKAFAYKYINDYDNAMVNINSAIERKDDYAKSYLFRYYIRMENNQTTEQNEDVDFLKYRELINSPILSDKELSLTPTEEKELRKLTEITFIDSVQKVFPDVYQMRLFNANTILRALIELEELLIACSDSVNLKNLKTFTRNYAVNLEHRAKSVSGWDSIAIQLTYQIGVVKYLVGDFSTDDGACTWLKGASRKGFDISKFQAFCDTCTSDYSEIIKKLNPKQTYRFNRVILKNKDRCEETLEFLVNPNTLVSHRIECNCIKKKNSLFRKNSKTKGSKYSFVVLFSGDTIPRRVQKYRRRKTGVIYTYDQFGNLYKRITTRRFLARTKIKTINSTRLVEKVVYRKTFFKKKPTSGTPFGIQIKRRTKLHVRTVLYTSSGKKKMILKGKNRLRAKRFIE